MNAKRWFYVMLSVPILFPVFLGLFAHLLYIVLPDTGFKWWIENGMLHTAHSSGSGSVGMDSGWRYWTILLFAATGIYPLAISFVCSLFSVYAPPYSIFAALIIAWSWKRPFSKIRKIIWLLPVIGYPFVIIGFLMTLNNSTFYNQLMATLGIQIIMLPIYFIVAYFYVYIAWHLVPAKYRKEI